MWNEPDVVLNETLRTIKERRSIRTFAKEDISEEKINILLRAANEAPSAHNQQSWRFIVLLAAARRSSPLR